MKSPLLGIIPLISLSLASFAGIGVAADSTPAPAFWSLAKTPPMGWNSWDSFGCTVTEAQTKANTDYMAEHLAKYGWQYIVVDIQWYEPQSKGFEYDPHPKVTMDEYGRLLPVPIKFPDAVDGKGFKPLADYIHSKGLKFGVHLLRGIPKTAVEKNLPILGTPYHAAEIADKVHVCRWNPDMYGVDMTKPGAQEYYNSVFKLFASWDLDFVKVDDLSAPYYIAEIAAIRKAIDQSGRGIVLSTSPGATPLAQGADIEQHANMWRIANDFWDGWKQLKEQFTRLDNWTPFRGEGHWPDADMLPLGNIRAVAPNGWTHFTHDEQFTLMSLWSIARSPLMMGGNLPGNDEFTLSLLTNDEVLAVNQNSANNRQLFRKDDLIVWVADVPGTKDKYLAVFNARDIKSEKKAPKTTGTNAAPTATPAATPVLTEAEKHPVAKIEVALKDLGFTKSAHVRDLWQKKDLGEFTDTFAPVIPFHGAGLYRVSE